MRAACPRRLHLGPPFVPETNGSALGQVSGADHWTGAGSRWNLQRHLLCLGLAALCAAAPASSQQPAASTPATIEPQPTTAKPALGREFLQHCAFVCVDIQPGLRKHLSEAEVPKPWRQPPPRCRRTSPHLRLAFRHGSRSCLRFSRVQPRLGRAGQSCSESSTRR